MGRAEAKHSAAALEFRHSVWETGVTVTLSGSSPSPDRHGIRFKWHKVGWYLFAQFGFQLLGLSMAPALASAELWFSDFIRGWAAGPCTRCPRALVLLGALAALTWGLIVHFTVKLRWIFCGPS